MLLMKKVMEDYTILSSLTRIMLLDNPPYLTMVYTASGCSEKNLAGESLITDV